MFVTRHHTKHMLNYEYFTAAGFLHSLLTKENVVRLLSIVRQYFLHFRNVLLNSCNNLSEKA